MAPLVAAALKYIASAVASAAVAKGVDAASPKTSVNPVGDAPALDSFDLQQLISEQQRPSQLPEQRLQLQNRLPRPY